MISRSFFQPSAKRRAVYGFAWTALWTLGAALALAAERDLPLDHKRAPVGEALTGPLSAEEQLDADRQLRETESALPKLEDPVRPWFAFKKEIEEGYGLQFGLDYTTLSLASTSAIGPEFGMAGLARLFGRWELLNLEAVDQRGALIFGAGHAHSIAGEVPPQSLGFETGYFGIPGTSFSDNGWAVTSLYWRHTFGKRLKVRAGLLGPSDVLNIYPLLNPLTDFVNQVFSVSPAIPSPGSGLGGSMGVRLGNGMYAIAGISDANGDPTKVPFDSFGDGEFFTHAEVGYMNVRGKDDLDHVQLTAWHADERTESGVPEDWGLALSLTRTIDRMWMPFLRAGWADGESALVNRTVSAGLARHFDRAGHRMGAGINWASPSDDALDDQLAAEVYFRFQATNYLAITPSVQLVGNPALNPGEELTAFFGLRMRAAF